MSAVLHAAVGELVPALEQSAEAVSLLGNLPEQPVTGVVYSNLARTYSIADMDERAVATLERALQLLETTDHVHETAACMANLGCAHVAWALRLLTMEQNDLARERFAVATDPLRAALENTARVPQPLVEARARSRLALARAALGDSREALTLARRAVTLADDVHAIEERVVGRIALGHALDSDGRSEEGLSILNGAYNLARVRLERWRVVPSHAHGRTPLPSDIASALDAPQPTSRATANTIATMAAPGSIRRAAPTERAGRRATCAENRQLHNEHRGRAHRSAQSIVPAISSPRSSKIWRRNARGVGLIDVDDFKLINDTRSYAMGDAVLQQVARLLRRVVSKTSWFVGAATSSSCSYRDISRKPRG